MKLRLTRLTQIHGTTQTVRSLSNIRIIPSGSAELHLPDRHYRNRWKMEAALEGQEESSAALAGRPRPHESFPTWAVPQTTPAHFIWSCVTSEPCQIAPGPIVISSQASRLHPCA